MPARPQTIDEYLEAVSDHQRAALQELRETIRAAAPDAEECISYQLAAFRQGGMLVAFGATAKHCAFYLMSSTTVEAHQEELSAYDTSKGTIRFRADQPLPAGLVRKLVAARLAENEAARGANPRSRAVRKVVADAGGEKSRTDPAVIAFISALDHPLKAEVETLRKIILDASPEIREGVKWNSPSFRTTEYFATLNLRDQESVRLILHLGAKVKTSGGGLPVPDPAGLLKWLGKDRCLVAFSNEEDVRVKQTALQDIIREWVRHL
jgi:uncharacterized protein YdhG (YjbR/CyaY superfamily)